MVNRPKRIGTSAESAVLKVIKPYFPQADRTVLSGAMDRGDIGHCGQFIFEVKGGAQTEQIGDALLAKWINEAEVEAAHANVRFGILVTQRKGVGAPNAHRWWAWVPIRDLAILLGGHYAPGQFAPVRLELGHLLEMLADHGYTDEAGDGPTTVVLADERVVHADVAIGYLKPHAEFHTEHGTTITTGATITSDILNRMNEVEETDVATGP